MVPGNGVSVQKIDRNASFFIQPRGRLVTTHHYNTKGPRVRTFAPQGSAPSAAASAASAVSSEASAAAARCPSSRQA
jgi:hypothetical protein